MHDGDSFKVQRNWRRAFACWRGIVNPVKHHAHTLELVMALGGPAFQASYDNFRADPNGQRLLRERPDITDVLLDEAYLMSLPKGSLGHAYLDFMRQNRLDAALYDEAHDLPAIARNLGWDDSFRYMIHRGIALHDMLHVLGGYGPDVGGEIGVIGFTHGLTPNSGTRLFLPLVLVLPTGAGRRDLLRWWREAARRGKAATGLMAQPYEELMARPLDEVRARVGIVPFAAAHPEGAVYSGFQFGRRRDRVTGAAYSPYVYDPMREHATSAPEPEAAGQR